MDRIELVAKWIMSENYGIGERASSKQLEALCKALLVCCNADGEISEGERDWVLGYAASMGCSDEALENLRHYKAQESIEGFLAGRRPAPKNGRRGIVYYAIKACSADYYDAQEKAMIRRLAPMLNVSEQTVSDLEALAIKEDELRRERFALLWPEERP